MKQKLLRRADSELLARSFSPPERIRQLDDSATPKQFTAAHEVANKVNSALRAIIRAAAC